MERGCTTCIMGHEASVDVTWWGCEGKGEGRRIPIGRPIANTKIEILDEERKVGIGVEGTIHIGGVGVGRGYLKRSGLPRREKYIPGRDGE